MMRKKIIVSCLSAGVLLLLPLSAQAAGLGKLSVKSALGQPLNAEIELLAEDKNELAALTARLAGNDAFRDARIDPAAILSSLKFTVDKKSDGRAVLKITSTKPVNDPFLDMLIELDWATGSIVREYTVLLDPPGAAAIQTAVPSTGVSQAESKRSESAKQSRSPVQSSSAPAMPSQPPRQSAGSGESTAVKNADRQTEQTFGPVKRGDTLTAIASQTKSEGVNLEQMLVSLYRENPKVFDGNNMNRLKTGQILKLPSEEQTAAIPVSEAARIIQLQSADWQSYRQKLAGEVVRTPATPEKSAQATGTITPKVEDRAARNQSGKDVLTLSKGEAPATGQLPASGKGAPVAQNAQSAAGLQNRLNALQEDAAAKQKALEEANSRVAALEKNIQDMQRLLDIKNQALAELQKNSGAVPDASVAAGATPAPSAPVAAASAPTAPGQPATAAAVAPLEPAVAPADSTPASTQADKRWYDGMNKLYLGAIALVLLLLALLALMMQGKRRRKGLSNFEDSIMAATDAKANTVYNTQGGAAVNTNNTSFLTDFSQAGLGSIDTHDVDPIAEAEVYMAYGRDTQAEEILKEALVKNPARHEIHLKLLEIYAARNNLPAFESIATELYAGLGGEITPVWLKAAELGRKLDPNNPLYSDHANTTASPASISSGGSEAMLAAAGLATAALTSRRQADAQEVVDDSPATAEIQHDAQTLDFSHPDEDFHKTMPDAPLVFDASPEFTASAEQGIIADAIEKQAAQEESIFHELDSMVELETTHSGFAQDGFAQQNELPLPDFDFTDPHSERRASITPVEPLHSDDSGLDFDFDLPETNTPQSTPDTTPAHDFSDISLDLNDIGDISQPAVEHDEAWQEVATKLDLARVYQEMGDNENAREILQEVLQEGNPAQKEDAQMLIAQLG